MAAIQVKTMQETLKKEKKNNFKIKHPAAEKQTAKSQEFSQKFSQRLCGITGVNVFTAQSEDD